MVRAKAEDGIENRGGHRQIIVTMRLQKLPLLPDCRTMHLMAKAAATVYDAAEENQQREEIAGDCAEV